MTAVPPPEPRHHPERGTDTIVQSARVAAATDALQARRDLSSLFDVVKDAHPAAGVDALAWELGRRVGAQEVSLLLVDIEGRALVRLIGQAERERSLDAPPGAPRIPLGDSAAADAIRQQQVQVVDDGAGVHAYVPVSERGETIGVLELRLPTAPSADVVSYLAAAAHALAYVVIADRRHTDVYEVSQRSRDLSLEAEIQRRLLPSAYSCQGPEFALAGWQIPASSAGGDTFDYIVGERCLSLSVTDAMGHGVAAAQLATLAVGSLRNSRRAGLGLVEQAERASAALAEHAAPDQFVTALLVDVDLATGAAEMVNAGHVRPLLVRGGRVTEVDMEPGMVLGVLPGLTYQAHRLQLAPGDRLVLMTDGMFEREAADAEVGELLAHLTPMHQREAAQALTRAVLEVSAGAVRDDATVMVLDWYGPQRPTSAPGHDVP